MARIFVEREVDGEVVGLEVIVAGSAVPYRPGRTLCDPDDGEAPSGGYVDDVHVVEPAWVELTEEERLDAVEAIQDEADDRMEAAREAALESRGDGRWS